MTSNNLKRYFLRSDTTSDDDFKWFSERYTQHFSIALQNFLGAEMTFQGHTKSSKMARFARKHDVDFVLSLTVVQATFRLNFVTILY